jgi:hypothetical protein
MSLSGPEALRSLEEALRDVRREEDEITKRLTRSAELVAKVRETEGELFRQLAGVRLDPATQAELNGRLSQAELKARAVQKSHAEALADAEQKLKALDKTVAGLVAARAEALQAIEKGQADLKLLRDKIGGQVRKDPAYAKTHAVAAQLAEIAAESISKTEQAEADRAQKGRPYRDDPLFMYLWERGYGTGSYRASNLIRYLDGLVARLIAFEKARPNFAMLNEIPLRLREHAEQQAELAAAAQQEVVALEDAAIDAAGGKPARQAVANAEQQIAGIDAQMVEAEDQRDETARAQHELAQGEEPAFADAVAALAVALSQEDIKILLADARATQTGQDDTIITQIDAARARAAEEEKDTFDQKARLKTLADRRRELEDIQYEFKKSRFDDPRSSFGEDRLAGDMLTDFLRGAITATSYWDSWRHSQNWSGGGSGPWGGSSRGSTSSGGFNWPDSSFGGGSNRPSGGGFSGNWGRLPGGGGRPSPGGGGFSRPRTGSAGNRTTGGFKTGGGF